MITQIPVPSGPLSLYPVVSMDTDLTGEHHDVLLSAQDNMFERAVASVLGSLLKTGDINQLSLIDLIYLFFVVRSSSVSPVYNSTWKCARIVEQGRVKSECGCTNKFKISLPKIKTRFIPKGFAYPKYKVVVDGIDTEVFARILTVADEFSVLDNLEEMGLTKESMRTSENLYKFSRARILQSMSFTDARVNAYPTEKKDEVLRQLPFTIVTKLFADLKAVDSYGPDLTPIDVTCSHCKGVSRLSIPFSAVLLLPE